MGFFFRKSVGFGPFRLNLSKSGVGASFGVRGARISSGPRGTYINVGRNGFYYRQKIDSPPSRVPQQEDTVPPPPGVNASRIESTDVSNLVDSSSEQLLQQINGCAARGRYAPLLFLLLLILVAAYLVWANATEQNATSTYSAAAKVAQEQSEAVEKAYQASIDKRLKAKDKKKAQEQFTSINTEAKNAANTAEAAKNALDDERTTLKLTNVGMIALSALGLVGLMFVHKRDGIASRKPITYELDEVTQQRFSALQAGCEKLGQAYRIWRVETQQSTSDWKRNAGANNLIDRSDCQTSKAAAPHTVSNIVPWTINCSGSRLFFFPDQILVLQEGRFGALSYSSLSIDTALSYFRETNGVPADSAVSGRTWRYVNKNGGPDRRFSDNREIPIAVYAQLDLRSPQGFHVRLHVSNTAAAEAFVVAVRAYAPNNRRDSDPGGTRHHESRTPPRNPKPSSEPPRKSAYDVLGLRPGARAQLSPKRQR